jgi:hypothetical protein
VFPLAFKEFQEQGATMSDKFAAWCLAGGLGMIGLLGGCRNAEEADDGSGEAGSAARTSGGGPVAPAPGGVAGAGEKPSKLARKAGRQPDGRKAPMPPPPPDYKAAVPVPGKPGYVFNPFTNNSVDVRGIPPGTLVRDPQDPDSDHKFRIPAAAAEPADEGGNGGLTEIPVPEIP